MKINDNTQENTKHSYAQQTFMMCSWIGCFQTLTSEYRDISPSQAVLSFKKIAENSYGSCEIAGLLQAIIS